MPTSSHFDAIPWRHQMDLHIENQCDRTPGFVTIVFIYMFAFLVLPKKGMYLKMLGEKLQLLPTESQTSEQSDGKVNMHTETKEVIPRCQHCHR